jgi:hypothetical protein
MVRMILRIRMIRGGGIKRIKMRRRIRMSKIRDKYRG